MAWLFFFISIVAVRLDRGVMSPTRPDDMS